MDITYIPMACGFVYLAAVVDWFTRRILSWRISSGMEVGFCLEAVEEAPAKHGRPDIFNTDQGSQFTSAAFTSLLLENKIAISISQELLEASNRRIKILSPTRLMVLQDSLIKSNMESQKMKQGDIVRCTYPGSYALTLEKTYEVLTRESSWITVRDDNGFIASYAWVRFEIVRHNAPTIDRSVA